MLPLIFYFCAAQIINLLVSWQKKLLLKNMKKCVKVTKQLVEKNATAPLRSTVKKILDRNEIEMADLEALRPYVLEGDVVTFRARLRGGYLKYMKQAAATPEEGAPDIEQADITTLAGNGKAFEGPEINWNIVRVKDNATLPGIIRSDGVEENLLDKTSDVSKDDKKENGEDYAFRYGDIINVTGEISQFSAAEQGKPGDAASSQAKKALRELALAYDPVKNCMTGVTPFSDEAEKMDVRFVLLPEQEEFDVLGDPVRMGDTVRIGIC